MYKPPLIRQINHTDVKFKKITLITKKNDKELSTFLSLPKRDPEMKLSSCNDSIGLTRQLQINERRGHLSASLRMRVSGNGLRREAVESPTERTGPRPLLQFAVCIEIGITILAPR